MDIKFNPQIYGELMMEQLVDVAKRHIRLVMKDPTEACGNAAVMIILLHNLISQMELWDKMPEEARERLTKLFADYELTV